MTENEKNHDLEEATFAFTMGDHAEAEKLLRNILQADPDHAASWHALTEVLFAERRFEEARDAGLEALRCAPDDVHVFTSLSRIYMELGDKPTAEKYGAQARMQGWKNELTQPDEET